MRGPLVRWALFSLLPVLALVTIIILFWAGIEGHLDDSIPALAVFAAVVAVFAPEWAAIIGMVRLFDHLEANRYMPGSGVGLRIVFIAFTVAALLGFRYAVWRWGARRLAAGRQAPYPQVLFLMAGAMTVLAVVACVVDPYMVFPIHSIETVLTFSGIALTLLLVPAVILLIRNRRRPRFWAGKNDRRCPDVAIRLFPNADIRARERE